MHLLFHAHDITFHYIYAVTHVTLKLKLYQFLNQNSEIKVGTYHMHFHFGKIQVHFRLKQIQMYFDLTVRLIKYLQLVLIWPLIV